MIKFLQTFIVLFLAAFNLNAQTHFFGEEIKQLLLLEIQSKVGEKAEILLPKTIQDYSFPQNNIELSFDFGQQNLIGNIFVGIEFRQNENLIKRVQVPVRIKIYRKVLVANRSILRGETITGENCSLETREITSNIDPNSLTDENCFGKIAKHNLVRGTIITNDLIQDKLAIRRGDKVRIVILSGCIQISTTGVALNDANAGETVRVRRDGSNKFLTGIASSDGCIVIAK